MPDKASTVTLAAAILYPEARKANAEPEALAEAVRLAAHLHVIASRQVRASGPTSKECTCGPARNWAQDGTPCHLSQCPLNG